MNKVIVTTTISPPGPIHEKYAKIHGWKFVVVGDSATPTTEWREFEKTHDSTFFLSLKDQNGLHLKLSRSIPEKCVQRRNMGFYYACRFLDATLIATIDDDNDPEPGWPGKVYIGLDVGYTNWDVPNGLAFDPLFPYDLPFWHRGYPIQHAPRRAETTKNGTMGKSSHSRVHNIQAGLWYGSPDVDAAVRLSGVVKPLYPCDMDWAHIRNGSDAWSPFNSQNTILARSCFPNYFLFPLIGRMDDIWAGYYLQALGHRVIYTKPTVIHDRHEHDPWKDFRDETLGYQYTHELFTALHQSSGSLDSLMKSFIPQASYDAWLLYRKAIE